MKNPFSNQQAAVNHGVGFGLASIKSESSTFYTDQQGYHMAKSAQQAANQIGNMSGSFQLSDDLYENMRMQQLESNIIQLVRNKEKAQLLLTLLHADEDELFRLKMFLG